MRVVVQISVEEVDVSAYVNKNGIVAVPVINRAQFACDLTVDLFGTNLRMATACLRDNSHNVTMVGHWAINEST